MGLELTKRQELAVHELVPARYQLLANCAVPALDQDHALLPLATINECKVVVVGLADLVRYEWDVDEAPLDLALAELDLSSLVHDVGGLLDRLGLPLV